MNLLIFLCGLLAIVALLFMKAVLSLVTRIRYYIMPPKNSHTGKRLPRKW